MSAGKLVETLSKFEIEVTENQAEKLIYFAKILIEENKKFNLTAILEIDEIIVKHFLDSLLILKCLDFNGEKTLIDIGSGAGFPSTPIAIVKENLKISQLDCLEKRVNFLKKVASELKINSTPIHERAEILAHNLNFRENFDFVVSRAVSKLNVLAELSLPFVKIGGFFVAYKGRNSEEELETAKKSIIELGGEISCVKNFEIEKLGVRNLIVIKKISQTSAKHPRRFNKILKTPI